MFAATPGITVVQAGLGANALQQPAPGQDIASRTREVEAQLRDSGSAISMAFHTASSLHCLGVVMVCFGILGFFLSFAYIAASLLIATGSILVHNFGVTKVKAHMINRFAVRDCCCAPFHLPALGIALFISGVASLSYSFSINVNTRSNSCNSTTSGGTSRSSSTDTCTTTTISNGAARYIAIASLGGIVLGVLTIIMAMVMIRKLRLFERLAGLSVTGRAQIAGIVMSGAGIQANPVVVMTVQQPQQPHFYTNPYPSPHGPPGVQQQIPMAIPVAQPYPQQQMQMQMQMQQPMMTTGYGSPYPQPHSPSGPHSPVMAMQPQPLQPAQIQQGGAGGGFAYPSPMPMMPMQAVSPGSSSTTYPPKSV
jgi:hypothetical protein